MVAMTDQQIDERTKERIHSFLDRKTEQFPELARIDSKHQPSSLLTRVQDMVTALTHSSQPRHIH